jgi:hypothetical protein
MSERGRQGESGRWRPLPRRSRSPLVSHRSSTDHLSDTKVRSSDNLEEGDGTEDENREWKCVAGCSRRRTSDPAGDLRPMGARSWYWALEDGDDSDEEVMSQSPSTPDLVRHAAVLGFSRVQLYEAEMALQDSSVRRRVEEPVTPGSTNAKTAMVRNIMKALTDVRRTAVKPWSWKLPRPRVSPMMTIGDCPARAGSGQQTCIGALSCRFCSGFPHRRRQWGLPVVDKRHHVIRFLRTVRRSGLLMIEFKFKQSGVIRFHRMGGDSVSVRKYR